MGARPGLHDVRRKALMRRTLVVLALITTLGSLAFRPAPARAADAGLCVLTSYTLTGSFNLIGAPASFHLSATGSCAGTSPVVVNVDYTSVGSWSCASGVARGTGSITAGDVSAVVVSYLVNTAGEYVIELNSANVTDAVAAGEFSTLPVPCVEGQTQTT